MKLLPTSLRVLFASTLLCLPSYAGVTIVDLGAIQDNCCGDHAANTYTEVIEAGDPAPVDFLHPNAATPNSDSAVFPLTDGATLQWTNVAAWNNEGDSDAGQGYFLHRNTDDPTGFIVTTANPGDLVSVDVIAGSSRDALTGYGDAAPGIVDVYVAGTSGWTNIGTSVGSSTGSLEVGNVPGDPIEGNIGAMRITITAIPEPASLALLGLAGVATLTLRRRI